MTIKVMQNDSFKAYTNRDGRYWILRSHGPWWCLAVLSLGARVSTPYARRVITANFERTFKVGSMLIALCIIENTVGKGIPCYTLIWVAKMGYFASFYIQLLGNSLLTFRRDHYY